MTHKILQTGNSVLIRTVTMHHLGRVVAVDAEFICLEKGGWLADTGRFSVCLEKGTVSEFELVTGEFLVARGGIIDIFQWLHDLPEKTV